MILWYAGNFRDMTSTGAWSLLGSCPFQDERIIGNKKRSVICKFQIYWLLINNLKYKNDFQEYKVKFNNQPSKIKRNLYLVITYFCITRYILINIKQQDHHVLSDLKRTKRKKEKLSWSSDFPTLTRPAWLFICVSPHYSVKLRLLGLSQENNLSCCLRPQSLLAIFNHVKSVRNSCKWGAQGVSLNLQGGKYQMR